MAQSNSTPRGEGTAQRAATQAGVLPRSGVILLGTFNKDGAARALIRTDRNRVAQVSVGDTVGRQYVAAINPGMLVLMRDGRIERLTIPGR